MALFITLVLVGLGIWYCMRLDERQTVKEKKEDT